MNEAELLAAELFPDDKGKIKLFIEGFVDNFEYAKSGHTSQNSIFENLNLEVSEKPKAVGESLGLLAGRFCRQETVVLYNGNFLAGILLKLKCNTPNFDKYYKFIEQIVQRWMQRYENKKRKGKTRPDEDEQYSNFINKTKIRIH